MDTIYVIIRGMRTCSDDDEIKGFKLTEAEAEQYCDEQQALEQHSSRYWMYDAVNKI
jgi:hypothetical protein